MLSSSICSSLIFDHRSHSGMGMVSDSEEPPMEPIPKRSIWAEFFRSLNEATIRNARSLNGTESLAGI